jgi:hypothetical protein
VRAASSATPILDAKPRDARHVIDVRGDENGEGKSVGQVSTITVKRD